MKSRISTLLVTVSAAALVTGNAWGQMVYDPANHAYFVVGNATLSTDISGNEVFVGKDNATNFATLPGRMTFTVATGATITQFGSNLPGGPYRGLNVFGSHLANITGGSVSSATTFDTGTITVFGGFVSSLASFGNSTLNLNGGTVGGFGAYDTSMVYLRAGNLNGFATFNSSTVNMTGGTVQSASLYNSSQVYINGGTVNNAQVNAYATLNVGAGGRVNDARGYQGTINISGGNVGIVGGDFRAPINISGGNVTDAYGRSSSDLHISGGTVGRADATIGTTMYISGGSVNDARALVGSGINVSGGNVSSASATHNGWLLVSGTGSVGQAVADRAYVSGGNLSSLNFNYSLDVSGGSVGFALGMGNTTATITGGDSYTILADTVDISGGTVWYAGGNTTTNLRGGTVNELAGGLVNITGGTANGAYGYSRLNMSGGNISQVLGQNDPGTVNLSGGSVGTFGAGLTGDRGIYMLDGTLNLFGGTFTRSDIVAGEFNKWAFPATGTFSTLTGTLLDGTPVNTTLFLADGATFNDRGGSSQGNAVMPDSVSNGVFTFTDVASGAWFDPPLVDSFLFTMTDGHLFTGILELPTGFSSAFDVRVGNLLLGSFGAGESVDFAAFGFASGVNTFSIENIFPGVDVENPAGFPVKLGFNTDFASFTMQGFGEGSSAAAPEPGTVGFLLLGGVCAALVGRNAVRR